MIVFLGNQKVSSAGSMTGAAWLSSARIVRCTVKSGNERNPRRMLYTCETAMVNMEEGGDNVKSAWPLRLGLHTCYNGEYKGLPKCKLELILKTLLSSDWGLKFDLMKLESLVIVNQHVTVNTFSGLVHTARHVKRVGNTRTSMLYRGKVGPAIGMKS